jgi:hypothetical protein
MEHDSSFANTSSLNFLDVASKLVHPTWKVDEQVVVRTCPLDRSAATGLEFEEKADG